MAPAPHGFTLLELMVTAGVVAVLLGLGIGFLGRSSGEPEAVSAIAGQLRAAALGARSRGLPTEVLLEPGREGARATVRARALEPVAVFGFEPQQTFASEDIRPVFGGEEVEQGRFGRARRPKPGDETPLLALPLPPRVADLRDGFAVRLDLRLDRRGAADLLRLGSSLEVTLDDAARPRVRLLPRAGEGRTGTAANLQPALALPVGRWCTFEVGADGSQLWVAVDGRVYERMALADPVHQQAGDLLQVAPGRVPLPGAVDEVQLFAYALAPAVDLPPDVVPAAAVRVAFDARGEPVEPPSIELRLLAEERELRLQVGAGGALQ